MSGYRTKEAFTWPEAAVMELTQRHTKGDTAAEIARAISKAFGVTLTRNAVIGKIHRLGIQRGPEYARLITDAQAARIKARHDAEVSRQEAFERRVTEKEAARLARLGRLQGDMNLDRDATTPVALHADSISTNAVGIMALTSRCCRWPLQRVAEDGSTLFCANAKDDGSSYCPGHRKRAAARQRTQAQIDADERRIASIRATLASKGLRWGIGGLKKALSA